MKLLVMILMRCVMGCSIGSGVVVLGGALWILL